MVSALFKQDISIDIVKAWVKIDCDSLVYAYIIDGGDSITIDIGDPLHYLWYNGIYPLHYLWIYLVKFIDIGKGNVSNIYTLKMIISIF